MNHEAIPLDLLVAQRAKYAAQRPWRRSLFGLDTGGEYVDSWRMHYLRLAMFGGVYAVKDDGPDSCVIVEVPSTPTGVAPSVGIFGWTGQINSSLAESSVWWAFDLISESEARQFLLEHRPTVLFRYYEDGLWHELETVCDAGNWIVVRAT